MLGVLQGGRGNPRRFHSEAEKFFLLKSKQYFHPLNKEILAWGLCQAYQGLPSLSETPCTAYLTILSLQSLLGLCLHLISGVWLKDLPTEVQLPSLNRRAGAPFLHPTKEIQLTSFSSSFSQAVLSADASTCLPAFPLTFWGSLWQRKLQMAIIWSQGNWQRS